MPVFADWRDIANLAYWVTGTEGSNPSLSASFIEFFPICIIVLRARLGAVFGPGGQRVGIV